MAGIKKLAFAVVAVAGIATAARFFVGQHLPAPIAGVFTFVERFLAGEAINDDGSGEATDCFTGSDGEYIIYEDDQGTAHIVEKPSQVPARFRAKARCSSARR